MQKRCVSWEWRSCFGTAGAGILVMLQSMAVPLIATAQPNQNPASPPSPNQLSNTAWLLEDLSGTGVVDRVQTTLHFGTGDRLFGSGGCNRYNARATLANDQLTVGGIASTKKMCPQAVMNQELRYFQAIGQAQRVSLQGPYLLIYHQGSNSPLRFTQLPSQRAEK